MKTMTMTRSRWDSTVLLEDRSATSITSSDVSGAILFACDDAVRIVDARLCFMRVYIANTHTLSNWPLSPTLVVLASMADM